MQILKLDDCSTFSDDFDVEDNSNLRTVLHFAMISTSRCKCKSSNLTTVVHLLVPISPDPLRSVKIRSDQFRSFHISSDQL